MTFSSVAAHLQQFSPFRNDFPPADLAARLSHSQGQEETSSGNQDVPARILDRRNHIYHPAFRGTSAGMQSCPAKLGNAANHAAAAEPYSLGQVLKQLSDTFWKTLGWNTSASSATPSGFKPLEFASAEKWPAAADAATDREKEALKGLVGLIEQHAKGIYENFLQKYHQTGKGITEIEQLVGRDLTVYLNKLKSAEFSALNIAFMNCLLPHGEAQRFPIV